MRKLLVLLAVVLLALPSAGEAQAPSVGLRGGLNLASFGGDRIVDSESRAGFTFGAFVSIPIISSVSLQPEVVFSRRGATSAAYDYDAFPQDGDAPSVGVFISEKTSHDYLEVPVLLKLGLSPESDAVRPVIFAGPSVGFLLRTSEFHGEDYSEYLNNTDFGLIFGGGVELGRVSIDARYNLGLSTIDKDFQATFGNVPGDVKNRAFTFTAGFNLF